MTHFTQQDNILLLHIAGQLLLREDAVAGLGGAVQGSGERGLSSGIRIDTITTDSQIFIEANQSINIT